MVVIGPRVVIVFGPRVVIVIGPRVVIVFGPRAESRGNIRNKISVLF